MRRELDDYVQENEVLCFHFISQVPNVGGMDTTVILTVIAVAILG